MNDDFARNQDLRDQKEEKSAITEAAKKAISKKIKAMPLKTKLIIIGVIAGIVLFLLMFVVLTMPIFMFFFFEDGSGGAGAGGSGFTYIDTNSSEKYWWPVGGAEVTSYNDKKFATGAPTATTITSYFGYRDLDGDGKNEDYHSGIDISNNGEHYIIAVSNGKVIDVVANEKSYTLEDEVCKNSTMSSYGNYITIEHSNGTLTRYAHLKPETITVSIGEEVNQGQIIALMGTTGCSTGVHLHFEIRNSVDNLAFNPLSYISIQDQ